MSNNKQLGTEFEQEFCERLAHDGFWVHFIAPDRRGAQPFDIVAAKDGRAFAIDCKTCVDKKFSISRLEENQKTAFELWMSLVRNMPYLAVKHNEQVYMIAYTNLKAYGSVDLERMLTYEKWLSRIS